MLNELVLAFFQARSSSIPGLSFIWHIVVYLTMWFGGFEVRDECEKEERESSVCVCVSARKKRERDVCVGKEKECGWMGLYSCTLGIHTSFFLVSVRGTTKVL